MEAREARAEFNKGRLTVEQLLDIVERQEQMIKRLLGRGVAFTRTPGAVRT